MKKFRTLELAVEFYDLIKPLEMPAHLREQILRSSSSISLNLAEGNAKFSKRDKMRIYQIALGSLRETQVILRLAEIRAPKVLSSADRLGASIYKLIESHR